MGTLYCPNKFQYEKATVLSWLLKYNQWYNTPNKKVATEIDLLHNKSGDDALMRTTNPFLL